MDNTIHKLEIDNTINKLEIEFIKDTNLDPSIINRKHSSKSSLSKDSTDDPSIINRTHSSKYSLSKDSTDDPSIINRTQSEKYSKSKDSMDDESISTNTIQNLEIELEKKNTSNDNKNKLEIELQKKKRSADSLNNVEIDENSYKLLTLKNKILIDDYIDKCFIMNILCKETKKFHNNIEYIIQFILLIISFGMCVVNSNLKICSEYSIAVKVLNISSYTLLIFLLILTYKLKNIEKKIFFKYLKNKFSNLETDINITITDNINLNEFFIKKIISEYNILNQKIIYIIPNHIKNYIRNKYKEKKTLPEIINGISKDNIYRTKSLNLEIDINNLKIQQERVSVNLSFNDSYINKNKINSIDKENIRKNILSNSYSYKNNVYD
jgi:hypothetical protein